MKERQLFWAYLPIQVFGRACGLSFRQIRMVQGLMREKTRATARKESGLIEGGAVPAMRGQGNITCPLLRSTVKYVSFGGNLRKHRARGYQIVGSLNDDSSRLGGWMRRFGYPATGNTSAQQIQTWTAAIFEDLAVLSRELNLVVACLGRDGSWRSIDELPFMLRSERGTHWLNYCSLRIFAPKDHLIQWRMWIAKRLGFSFIPGGEWSQSEVSTQEISHNVSMSGEAIKAEMLRLGIAQKQIAAELGWSESRVSRQLGGISQLTLELIQGFCRIRDRMES